MQDTDTVRLVPVYKVWISTRQLLEYADWLPEVVGSSTELKRQGSVPLCMSTDELFKDAIRYRNEGRA